MQSFGQQKSFCHNLNQTSNQNTSLTKVVTLDLLIDDMKPTPTYRAGGWAARAVKMTARAWSNELL